MPTKDDRQARKLGRANKKKQLNKARAGRLAKREGEGIRKQAISKRKGK